MFLSRFAPLEVFLAHGQSLHQWKGFSFSRERFASNKTVKKLTENWTQVKSKAKFHISLGHETVLAKLTLLHGGEVLSSSTKEAFDFSPEYHYQVKLTKKRLVD